MLYQNPLNGQNIPLNHIDLWFKHALDGNEGELNPLKCTWLLGIIGFDTSHVGRFFRHEDLHQFHQAVFEISWGLQVQTWKHI